MYSTIQAWNADETLMILYDQSNGVHQLLDGMAYEFIRNLDDISSADIEQIFWSFQDPDIFYYPDGQSSDFVEYSVSTGNKNAIVNLNDLSGCSGDLEMGDDIQMMSWDSDVFTFRCENEMAYAYRISSSELTEFNIDNLSFTAAAVAPSGNKFYHNKKVYNESGNIMFALNESAVEHSCVGKLSNGNDAHFSIAFAEGPNGDCLGDIIAHDLSTGICFPVISQDQGYDYPQSGTHISAVAHKNTEGGWIAASMMGYDQDGQSLLDQELVIAKVEEGNIKVCRIGHHRSDEEEFDYWGEPHAVISPSGTRVLFGSDWSGLEDGGSVDSYVVELPAFENTTSVASAAFHESIGVVSPNPAAQHSRITFEGLIKNKRFDLEITDVMGRIKVSEKIKSNEFQLDQCFISGIYYYRIFKDFKLMKSGSFIVK